MQFFFTKIVFFIHVYLNPRHEKHELYLKPMLLSVCIESCIKLDFTAGCYFLFNFAVPYNPQKIIHRKNVFHIIFIDVN